VRPLTYGLILSPQPGVEIVYDEPGQLAEALDRWTLDAALVPAIEYLRGVGRAMVDGPALVARSAGPSVMIVSQKPVADIRRIAVNEFCRTPVVVARVVLHRLHGITPDLLVEKDFNGSWREKYDAILLGGDAALDYAVRPVPEGCEIFNLAEMWETLTKHALPLGVWAYTNRDMRATYSKWLMTSRNLGMQNLSRLADGIAATTHYDSAALYDYFTHSWSYQLDEDAVAGLYALEELALEYDLLRRGRLERVFTG
jgi:predicted solute-binding protein